MRLLSRSIAFLGPVLLAADTFAQQPAPNWVEETMYHSGKINTVIAVVAVILTGIAIWLFTIDRKVGRLEKDMKKDRP